jgi:hypothetical protein
MASGVRKWVGRILVQWALGALGGIIIGILGVMVGAGIGGNHGFPGFGGATAGYEAGGVFFGLLGIALGSFAAVVIIQMVLHERCSFLVALLGSSVSFAADLALYDYYAPPWTLILIVAMPPTLAVVGIHWRRILAFFGRRGGIDRADFPELNNGARTEQDIAAGRADTHR